MCFISSLIVDWLFGDITGMKALNELKDAMIFGLQFWGAIFIGLVLPLLMAYHIG